MCLVQGASVAKYYSLFEAFDYVEVFLTVNRFDMLSFLLAQVNMQDLEKY